MGAQVHKVGARDRVLRGDRHGRGAAVAQPAAGSVLDRDGHRCEPLHHRLELRKPVVGRVSKAGVSWSRKQLSRPDAYSGSKTSSVRAQSAAWRSPRESGLIVTGFGPDGAPLR
jgi:hypothetical protein